MTATIKKYKKTSRDIITHVRHDCIQKLQDLVIHNHTGMWMLWFSALDLYWPLGVD